MKDIRPADVELLARELNLRETTATTLDALVKTFGPQDWFKSFKEMKVGALIETEEGKRIPAPDSVAAWANQEGVNVMAAEGLHSKLRRLFNKPYILEKPASDGIGEIIKALDAGQHVVLSFGQFESDLDYLLVANLLSRHIRATWEQRTNEFRPHGQRRTPPAHHRGGRSPQTTQPGDGQSDHLQHDRPRVAQILCHPLDRGPAPVPNLR